MLVEFLLPLLAINEVREYPVERGHCVERYAQTWADTLADDQRTRHGLVDSARRGCKRPWLGQVIVRSPEPITVREAIPLWLDSPKHAEILRSPLADRAGIGRASSDGYYVIVINFAADRN